MAPDDARHPSATQHHCRAAGRNSPASGTDCVGIGLAGSAGQPGATGSGSDRRPASRSRGINTDVANTKINTDTGTPARQHAEIADAGQEQPAAETTASGTHQTGTAPAARPRARVRSRGAGRGVAAGRGARASHKPKPGASRPAGTGCCSTRCHNRRHDPGRLRCPQPQARLPADVAPLQ